MAGVGHHRTLDGGLLHSAQAWPAAPLPRRSPPGKIASDLGAGGEARHGHRGAAATGRDRHGAIDWLVLGCVVLTLVTVVAGAALLRLVAEL